MKNIFFVIAIGAITLSACNNSSNQSEQSNKMNDSSKEVQKVAALTSPVNGLLQIYLQMKNDFVNDDDKGAAKAANEMLKALNDFDKSSLKEEEKKAFEDIADDAKEHAEHIGANGGNIKHQREHFVILSKDMADLIKTFGNGGQTLYKDFCPMANDGKGAIWISELKEIKNPYLGKKMPTCGTVKETIQ